MRIVFRASDRAVLGAQPGRECSVVRLPGHAAKRDTFHLTLRRTDGSRSAAFSSELYGTLVSIVAPGFHVNDFDNAGKTEI
jgi:hypothetical protein